MDIVIGPVVEKIVQSLWAPIARQFSYLRNLQRNLETLREKMEELNARETVVKEKLNIGKVNLAKEPNDVVQLWLKNVGRITSEEDYIKKEFEENKRYLSGCLPNCYKRIKLSKLAAEKIQVVEELEKKCKDWNDWFADPKPTTGVKISTLTLVGRTTAEKTLETVWECLIDPDIGIIGVYGMGGIGKTTIMKHINNRLVKEGNRFNKIIWVNVSKVFNLEKLQNSIAAMLELDISTLEDEMARAAKLTENLEQRKFVLILDDVWNEFSLEMVGIPLPSSENGSKLILTTRSLDVCVRMNCRKTIKVERLSDEEAWELFKQNVGNNVKLNPEVQEIAKCVAQECGCLPLAIVTVGQAMKQKDDIRDWRNALRELKSSMDGSMNDQVFTQLKFSYERLSDDMLRECFLYCALYPEDHNIPSRELIEYWIAEGLIDDFKNREAEMDKGHVVLEKLKNSCMLENVNTLDGGEYVKMHDLIRDMAINITSESDSNRFMVKAGVGVKESLEVKEWSDGVERISLMNNYIKALLDQPNCPKLSTLLLQNNPLLQNIPQSFFEQMHNLRVLDLSETHVGYLPDSLSDLVNLRLLLLEGCMMLKRVPSLSKLRELRVLNLSGTGIEALPQGLEKATNLRHINLNDTEDLRLFPVGVLPNLPLLEDLSMRDCGWKWKTSAIHDRGASIQDIISLTGLATLKIDIEDLQTWTKYIRYGKWKSLKSFHFVIGQLQVSIPSQLKFSVKIGGCNLVCGESALMFPGKTQFLYMKDCIIQSSEMSNLKDLKDLYISGCDGIECIVGIEKENTFSALEILSLASSPRLSTVCKGVVPSGTLASLKVLNAYECLQMKNAFPLGLFQHLPNLEEIKIVKCKQIEEIAIGEAMEDEEVIREASNSTITLPNLKQLHLEGLPKLKRISKRELACESLYSVTVLNCPLLRNLPFSMDNIPPSLEEIKGGKVWWHMLEWDNLDTRTIFQQFFKNTAEVAEADEEEQEEATSEEDEATSEEEDEATSEEEQEDEATSEVEKDEEEATSAAVATGEEEEEEEAVAATTTSTTEDKGKEAAVEEEERLNRQ